MFQFTRPHWGATRANANNNTQTCFNSRARTGARHTALREMIAWWEFQFTRPHWGATEGVAPANNR